VLPPVPTEGLTAADVGDLATRVHEQMLEALREISDPNAPPPPVAPAQAASMSQSEKEENPVVAPLTPKETTPVPFAGDVDVPQSRNVPEERPTTPHSEVTSEGSTRRSENDTEEEEGMVLVGRPR
jgi:lysophosphatidate acyltransferase